MVAWPTSRGLAAAAVALAVAGTALIALGMIPSLAAPVVVLPRGAGAPARLLPAFRRRRLARLGGRVAGGCCEEA
jgi:hypothetical protein